MRPIKKILFVRQGNRSFFDADLEILSGFASVRDFDNYPPSLNKFFPLIKAVLQCDLVYIWFMGRHSVAPLLLGKLFGKKIILVEGGWDAANCPEISYGLMRPGPARFWLQRLLRLPDRVLAISESNRKEILKNAKVPSEKVRLIYLGFKEVSSPLNPHKEKRVITIGDVTLSNLKRKGLEFFVKVAALMPHIPFVMIGKENNDGASELLKGLATSNVIFAGRVSDKEKEDYLKGAAVYAQFSHHEAFGAAVAEAMQHGCVPVVTNQYSLPEVVGDAGYVIAYNDLQAASSAILKGLENRALSSRSRARIQEKFPLKVRAEEIRRLVYELEN